MRPVRATLVVCLGAMALGGCTLISTTSQPEIVASANVPLGLLNPTIPFTVDAQVRFVSRDVYLINPLGQLDPMPRLMTSPASVFAALHYLFVGPSVQEQSRGITSALPATLVLNQATVQGGVALVDVSSDLRSLSAPEQRLAVAQMLYTARSFGAARGIRVSIDQVPFSLRLSDGRRVTLVRASDLGITP